MPSPPGAEVTGKSPEASRDEALGIIGAMSGPVSSKTEAEAAAGVPEPVAEAVACQVQAIVLVAP